MKLIYKIAARLSFVMMLLLALWTTIFYFKIVDEINDETDDSLEDYSELIIMRMLAGKQLPQENSGSNNSYSLVPVTDEYAKINYHIKYYDSDIYIPEKKEYEPARMLKTVFLGNDSLWYELTVATPTFEREDLLHTILWWICCLYIVILVTGVSVTMLVFRKSMWPLYSLLHWLDSYIPGQKKPLISDNTDITEFKRLNNAVWQAICRYEEAYDKQKQFIGNASHELQTPLAILGNKMEWMLNNSNLTEQQMLEVMDMLRTQRNIVKLNKDLLLLTKIDNHQFMGDVSKIKIADIVKEQQVVCGEIYEEKGIFCNVQQLNDLVVKMNISLVNVLIANLLRNAYIHTPNGGKIEIALSGRTLSVANTGVYALDGERIFERFYQGSKKEGSTGLGLSIAKAVCNAYNIGMRYSFANGMHVFTVTF